MPRTKMIKIYYRSIKSLTIVNTKSYIIFTAIFLTQLSALYLGHYFASEISPSSVGIMSADARNWPMVTTEGIRTRP